MPTGAHESLDRLYARQKLLFDETSRLEAEHDALDPKSDRAYILGLQITALREEWSRFSAMIAAVLERDLER